MKIGSAAWHVWLPWVYTWSSKVTSTGGELEFESVSLVVCFRTILLLRFILHSRISCRTQDKVTSRCVCICIRKQEGDSKDGHLDLCLQNPLCLPLLWGQAMEEQVPFLAGLRWGHLGGSKDRSRSSRAVPHQTNSCSMIWKVIGPMFGIWTKAKHTAFSILKKKNCVI